MRGRAIGRGGDFGRFVEGMLDEREADIGVLRGGGVGFGGFVFGVGVFAVFEV